MSRWRAALPLILLLLAGVVLNFRQGRPVLGSLYAIALAEVTICLPAITAKLGIATLLHH